VNPQTRELPAIGLQYRALQRLLQEVLDLRQRFYGRLSTADFWNFVRVARRDTLSAFALHEKQVAARTTDEERQQPLFSVALDEHWPEKFAHYAAAELQLDGRQVKGLLRLHEIEEQHMQRTWGVLSPKNVFGIVLATAAFVASQVPKELFGDSKDYDTFKRVVFWVLIGAVVYLLLMAFVMGPLAGHSDLRHRRKELVKMREVLLFLDWVCDEKDEGIK
jgi:hypothetical protein